MHYHDRFLDSPNFRYLNRMNSAIIIPAYSRPNALSRLLQSLNNADFPTNDIELIISLDGGASKSVRNIAHNFIFRHGSVSIYEQSKNLGLRKHIIWCGDQTKKYGSVILLEDDLYVDRYFYQFASQSLKYYQHDEKISGISLYSYAYNYVAKLAFEPMFNGYSGFFMQVPSSWGQAWTEIQWGKFKKWYDDASSQTLDDNPELPKIIKNWPESSWKKYFYTYMIEHDLYFFYPYLSYSTNCSDPGGVHAKSGTNHHQVPLGAYQRPPDKFRFCDLKGSEVLYDAYFEPLAPELFKGIGYPEDKIEIDIYGTKPINLLNRKEYVLTSKKCSTPLKTYQLSFRPAEKTVLEEVVNQQPVIGFSNHVYLAKAEDIITSKRPFYEQINHYSYYQTVNKYYIRRYIQHIIQKWFSRFT